MATRDQQPNKPGNPDADLAIAALDGNPNPLDQDMSAVDPDPTSLDLILPGKPDNRDAGETGAARGRTKGRR